MGVHMFLKYKGRGSKYYFKTYGRGEQKRGSKFIVTGRDTSTYSIMADEGARRTVDVWVNRSKSLRVLVFRKMGAGKLSLINTLFKEEVAREGSTLYTET